MKRKKAPIKFTEYIVSNKPTETLKILYNFGMLPPRNNSELLEAANLLVKKKGRNAIKELIKIHPDKDIILVETGHHKPNEDFCNYCSENKHSEKNISDLSTIELKEELFKRRRNIENEKFLDSFEDNKIINDTKKTDDENMQKNIRNFILIAVGFAAFTILINKK